MSNDKLKDILDTAENNRKLERDAQEARIKLQREVKEADYAKETQRRQEEEAQRKLELQKKEEDIQAILKLQQEEDAKKIEERKKTEEDIQAHLKSQQEKFEADAKKERDANELRIAADAKKRQEEEDQLAKERKQKEDLELETRRREANDKELLIKQKNQDKEKAIKESQELAYKAELVKKAKPSMPSPDPSEPYLIITDATNDHPLKSMTREDITDEARKNIEKQRTAFFKVSDVEVAIDHYILQLKNPLVSEKSDFEATKGMMLRHVEYLVLKNNKVTAFINSLNGFDKLETRAQVMNELFSTEKNNPANKFDHAIGNRILTAMNEHQLAVIFNKAKDYPQTMEMIARSLPAAHTLPELMNKVQVPFEANIKNFDSDSVKQIKSQIGDRKNIDTPSANPAATAPSDDSKPVSAPSDASKVVPAPVSLNDERNPAFIPVTFNPAFIFFGVAGIALFIAAIVFAALAITATMGVAAIAMAGGFGAGALLCGGVAFFAKVHQMQAASDEKTEAVVPSIQEAISAAKENFDFDVYAKEVAMAEKSANPTTAVSAPGVEGISPDPLLQKQY